MTDKMYKNAHIVTSTDFILLKWYYDGWIYICLFVCALKMSASIMVTCEYMHLRKFSSCMLL